MVGEYLSRALEDVRAGIKQARGEEEGEVARGAAHNPKPWSREEEKGVVDRPSSIDEFWARRRRRRRIVGPFFRGRDTTDN